MPVPTPQQFRDMLDAAKSGRYAYPAINVTSLETANAAMQAFADTKSDGIVQLSLGAGKYASGPAADAVEGSISIAEHVHRIAAKLPVFVALHTDHCQLGDISFIERLLDATKKRREAGKQNLFNGHMFDGSALPLEQNLKIARKLLEQCAELEVVPEFEAGVVGGEEEGAAATDDQSKMYTTPEDMVRVCEVLEGVGAPFLFAATFGNVHGMYKPGNVKLRPEILSEGQKAVAEKFGKEKEFYLVFHGGSGTPVEQIQETLDYGVVKMNVDTAAQYSFTREVADHMFSNYSGILMIDGEMGNKKLFDPRAYLKAGMKGMSQRVVQAVTELRSNGKTICS